MHSESLLCGAGGATYAVAMFLLIVAVTVVGQSNLSDEDNILISLLRLAVSLIGQSNTLS